MPGEAWRQAAASALQQAGFSPAIDEARDLSGGCIHRVMELAARPRGDGEAVRLVVKVNEASALRLFEEEAESLRAIAATRTVLVPDVLAVTAHAGWAALLMTRIESPAQRSLDQTAMWRAFGDDLAALHAAPLAPELRHGYGFVSDNHLGTTPQPNGWRDDWVDFNAEHRLGHQLRTARTRGLLTADEAQRIDAVIARLDHILPHSPGASLLHGDLWSGNALPARTSPARATCAVIDPASSVGDALADIAMMQLFGGFPAACFAAWSAAMRVDLASDDACGRIAVYQLYHVLNHVNIFGRGYAGQAMALARSVA